MIFLNRKGGAALAILAVVLLFIFILATAIPELKETILQILGAI